MAGVGDGDFIRTAQILLAFRRKSMSGGIEGFEREALQRFEVTHQLERFCALRLDVARAAGAGEELAEVRMLDGHVQPDVAHPVTERAVRFS